MIATSAFSRLPNVGSFIPSIDKAFIVFDEIPVGRQTCDVCGDLFSITGDLKDCPVGLPCRHVHCFECTWDWLHRTHSCPECNTKYTDIRPICVALEHEAYLCRYQGFPPSTRPQVGSLTPSKLPADIIQEENRNVTFVDPRNFDVGQLPERGFHRGIHPRTEEIEGAMTGMYLHPEKKDGTSAPHPSVHSGTDTPKQEPEAKIPPQQPHIHQRNQTQSRPPHPPTTTPQPPRKASNGRRKPAEHDRKKRRAPETDSQRADRLKKQNAYNHERLAKETQEQRGHRLEKVRRAKNARRAREVQEEKERQEQKRLAKMGAGGKEGAKA